ncbi:MAG: 1-acyl-sn-glycerol-3-phosphate acyltransferase [Spirochaetales bacterium]|nr:1-acyl-sn-glycerol-3-phosphate acyltransferase [Candidatus Physcosoma equi]
MKIKEVQKSFEEVMALPKEIHQKPLRPALPFRMLLKVLAHKDLKETHFTHREIGMERLGKDEPALILMNHSAFIDLEIAASVLYPRPFNIVCTSDGFVGKSWLMRSVGCIPTAKFVSDTVLIKDMLYALRTLKSSVLMYPEASYSFDGTATPLPESLGKCLKVLKVPVIMIRTYGAFQRDPLYNGLRLRKVDVSADVEYLLSPEEIAQKSVGELNDILSSRFSFDNWKWQKENGVLITEPFRAEGLSRVLYKCPHCGEEGFMKASGTILSCVACGKEYELLENGEMKAVKGETEFSHIPSWYRWEREEVRKEILQDSYSLNIPVTIRMLVDSKAIYTVGSGRLIHNREGFHLTGCDGKLDYRRSPLDSYSLYSDYYWYEIGDMIAIGDRDKVYYCFPEEGLDVAAKTRLAQEEIYRLEKENLHKDA